MIYINRNNIAPTGAPSYNVTVEWKPF